MNIFKGEKDNLVKTVADVIGSGNESVADLAAFQLSLGQDEDVLKLFFNQSNQFPSSLLVALAKASGEFPLLSKQVAGLTRHKDEWVAYSAVEALEQFGAEHVGDLVIQLLKELEGMPVVAAIRVAVSLKLNEAVPIIETLTNSASEDIRETAKQAMMSLKTGDSR